MQELSVALQILLKETGQRVADSRRSLLRLEDHPAPNFQPLKEALPESVRQSVMALCRLFQMCVTPKSFRALVRGAMAYCSAQVTAFSVE